MERTKKQNLTITAHCLVKNEARFVWYAVMSVINHVDKILLWDTGSSDGTVQIANEIKKVGKGKVSFREYGSINAQNFMKARQEMLDETDTDWFIVVDGDEVWWEDSIKQVVQVITSSAHSTSSGQASKAGNLESIVVPTINLVGDIYHYQEEAAGGYHLAGRTGHLNLRAINKRITGLHSYGPHGQWGWVDGENKMIQYRNQSKIHFIDAPYLHATHLVRASTLKLEENVQKRKLKRKYELGIPFPPDFYYPEVFFRSRPEIVPSIWERMNRLFYSRALIETPLRKLKRKVMPKRIGY